MRTITLRLEDELHQAFKIHSVVTKENMQDILIRLIKQELDQAQALKEEK